MSWPCAGAEREAAGQERAAPGRPGALRGEDAAREGAPATYKGDPRDSPADAYYIMQVRHGSVDQRLLCMILIQSPIACPLHHAGAVARARKPDAVVHDACIMCLSFVAPH